MKNFAATKGFALAFGLFLGLCILKFGNPVILDRVIKPPESPGELLNFAWPLHWANYILLVLVFVGGILVFPVRAHWPQSLWLWLIPLAWFGWQLVSATQTVDAHLTSVTLWQFFGCILCYFLGAKWLGTRALQHWLFIGVFAGYALCLVQAVNQRLVEFPQNHQMLVEGERCGWTNFSPEAVVEMRRDGIIVTTNGLEQANPVILAKFEKGRVMGTMVYPNALASLILLLLPVSLAYVVGKTRQMKAAIRMAAITLVVFLGLSAFYWSGSKFGWLIALGMLGLILLKADWSRTVKWIAVVTVLMVGLGIFAIRFHHYFATGAHSANARLDYWHAAMRVTMNHPFVGTGPGTFQRPYAEIKRPDAEMTRLVHNDYLEQFSDSGVSGGVAYVAWIFLSLAVVWKKYWHSNDWIGIGILIGLLAWFIHGAGEFGFYIPGLAWLAFTLLGSLIAGEINEFDS
jgi:hypothetical protein